MTVSVQTASEYILGDGINTTFDFSYIGALAADNQVTYTDIDGNVTVLDPSVYTLTLNAAVPGQIWGIGGTLTYPLAGSPIPTGATLLVQRVLPYLQQTSISNQGNFYPEAVEAALDVLCMEIQQLYSLIQMGSSSSSGNVTGPGSSSNYGVAYFIGTNGQRIASTAAGTAGYVLTGNGTSAAPNFQLPPGQANGIISVVTYTPGTYTLTPPDGATMALVQLQGGGGGGEGVSSPGSGSASVGSGGSGGGWLQSLITSGFDGATLVVGDFGAGGPAGNNDGADGEDTTLLALVASGGLGGTLGTMGSSTFPITAHSMTGGSVTGGDVSRPGGASGAQITTTASVVSSGSGGTSQLSPGAAAVVVTTNTSAAGITAVGFGGGGSGAAAAGTGIARAGGNGAPGTAIVTYYGYSSANSGASGEATQAQEEAGVLGTVYTSPRVQKYSDSAAKVVAVVAADGTLEFGYNVDNVVKNSTGDYTITFINAFTTTSYGAMVTLDTSGLPSGAAEQSYANKTTASIDVRAYNGSSPAIHDTPFTLTCYGRQVSASTYSASAVNFDGAAQLGVSTSLVGVAASSSCCGSFWIKIDTSASMFSNLTVLNQTEVFTGPTTRYPINVVPIVGSSECNISIYVAPAEAALIGTDVFAVTTAVDGLVKGVWTNVLFSIDTNAATSSKTMQIYFNDVAQSFLSTNDPIGPFDIGFANSGTNSVTVGAADSLVNPYLGDMADFWFAPGVFIDFSVEANRRKFIDAVGRPVDLGTDGSIPTGTAPAIFFTGNASTFGTNVGTGGTFATTGTLTNATTAP